MTKTTRLFGLAMPLLALAFALGTSRNADAALISYICDDALCTGGNDTVVTDQGPGDNFPGSAQVGQINSGAINFNGFTIVTNVSQSKPLIGSAAAPQLDLTFSAVTSDNLTHTIWLYASDTGFTGGGPMSLTLGGTQPPAGGTFSVAGRAWGGTSNVELDINGGNLFAAVGPTSATPFALSDEGLLIPQVSSFSLTIGMVITRTAAGTTTGDLNLSPLTTTAVPEPASMLLLGTGLAGLLAGRRRRA